MTTRPLTDDSGYTCDWGGCNDVAVAERHSPELGWLPVCARHMGPPPRGAAVAAAEARGYQKAIDALRAEGVRALERFTEAGSDSPKWDAYDAAADWLEFLREEETPPMRGDGK